MNTLLAPTVHPACMVLVDAEVERSVIARLRDNGVLPRDVAIVDKRSHRRHGLATVEALRATRFDAAVIVVGAFHSIDERIALLDAGADHVLHGPVSPAVLIAWTRSILRRTRALPPDASLVSSSHLLLRRGCNTVERRGIRTTLTNTEFDLLAVLARNAGRVVPRRHLLLLVWGIPGESSTNVLNVHIWSLRRKLASIGAPQSVRTVRGVGLRFTRAGLTAATAVPDRGVRPAEDARPRVPGCAYRSREECAGRLPTGPTRGRCWWGPVNYMHEGSLLVGDLLVTVLLLGSFLGAALTIRYLNTHPTRPHGYPSPHDHRGT